MSVSAAALTFSAAELSSGPANLSQAVEIQPSALPNISVNTAGLHSPLGRVMDMNWSLATLTWWVGFLLESCLTAESFCLAAAAAAEVHQ